MFVFVPFSLGTFFISQRLMWKLFHFDDMNVWHHILINHWFTDNMMTKSQFDLLPQFELSGNNAQRSHSSQILNDQSMTYILSLFLIWSLHMINAIRCLLFLFWFCQEWPVTHYRWGVYLQCLIWELQTLVVWCLYNSSSNSNSNMVHKVHLVTWRKMLRIYNLIW